jgi:subtilisin family serine protease
MLYELYLHFGAAFSLLLVMTFLVITTAAAVTTAPILVLVSCFLLLDAVLFVAAAAASVVAAVAANVVVVVVAAAAANVVAAAVSVVVAAGFPSLDGLTGITFVRYLVTLAPKVVVARFLNFPLVLHCRNFSDVIKLSCFGHILAKLIFSSGLVTKSYFFRLIV